MYVFQKMGFVALVPNFRIAQNVAAAFSNFVGFIAAVENSIITK